MNKLLITLFFVCVMVGVVVGATPSKVTTNAWFSASAVTGASVVEHGKFDSEPAISGTKYVIESELTAPVLFTPDQTESKHLAEVTFTLDTAVVPLSIRTEADLSGQNARVAFAVSQSGSNTDATAYYAWLGGPDWVQLSGSTPKAEGESYTLVVTFDNREGTKVRFAVDGTVLKLGNDEWLSYGETAVTPTMPIGLVGSGAVASFVGKQLQIETEIVAPTDCGPINIPEADLQLFKNLDTEGKGVDAFMAAQASEKFTGFETQNISVGAAYALGMIKKNDENKMAPVDDGVLKAHAVAQSTDTEKLALALNVTPPPDTGAKISYEVFKEGVDDPVNENNELSIPKDKLGPGLMKFTVKAIITK